MNNHQRDWGDAEQTRVADNVELSQNKQQDAPPRETP